MKFKRPSRVPSRIQPRAMVAPAAMCFLLSSLVIGFSCRRPIPDFLCSLSSFARCCPALRLAGGRHSACARKQKDPDQYCN